LSTCNLQGFEGITSKDNMLIVGAKVTLEQLAEHVKTTIPEFYKILWVFGAPQIRYAGTLAGNIANASPIGDTLPFLFVMEAEVEVIGVHGTRRIPICSLYTGYKQMDLSSDEIITRIFIPLPEPKQTLRLFKVSKREHLDISSFAAAFLVATEAGGNGRNVERIAYARVAFGGVGPVVLRMPETESFLQGKDASFETFDKAGAVALQEITPISDVRGSSDFRKQLAENIFLKFYCSIEEPEALCAV
jgi:xanthine dehydrogenase small subunit